MAQTIKLKRSATTGNVPTTSQLALGELGINTTDGKLFLKKSVSGTESIVEVGSTGSFLPLSGGTLTGNLNFGDNVKAQFGAGNDLQIYHDGSNSFIADVGTGNLGIRAENLFLQNADGSANYATASLNGAFTLSYNNSIRLATTSTGIDVNGSVTADGLTVDGGSGNSLVNFTPSGTYSTVVDFSNASSDFQIVSFGSGSASANNFRIRDDGASRFNIAGNGDISFYDSSGTSQSFFWDSSASCLGIGTTNPTSYYAKNLVVSAPSEGGLTIASTATSHTNYILFADGTSGDSAYRGQIAYNHNNDLMNVISSGSMDFRTGSSRDIRLTINADGSSEFSGAVSVGSVAQVFTSSDRGYFVAGTSDSSNQHLYLGSYHGSTLKELVFSGSNDALYPKTTASIDLGLTTHKFKNLNLSGTISSGAVTSTGLTLTGATGSVSKVRFQAEEVHGDIEGINIGANFGGLAFKTNTNGTLNTALTIDSSQNATFSGSVTADKYIMTGDSQIGQDYAYLKSNSTSNASLTLRKVSTGADSIDFLQLRSDGNSLIGKIEGDGDISFNSATFSGSVSAPNVDITGALFDSAVNRGLKFDSTSVKPSNGSGGDANNHVDLGTTSTKFKNLYLSGTISSGAITSTGLTLNVNDSTTFTSTSRANGFLQINNTNTTSGVFSGIELIATGTGSAGAAEIFCVDSGSGSGDLVFSTRNIGTWGEKLRISSDGSCRWTPDGTNHDMTLTADGNLLVGKTATDNTTTGVRIAPSFISVTSGPSANTAIFNRTGPNDGEVIRFQKDNVTVGSIGTVDGDFNIYAGASGHKGLRFGNGYIAPTGNSTAVENGTTDLGLSSQRFKDLYLSNKVYAAYIGASSDTDTSINFDTANTIKMFTGGQEAARITSGGEFLIGCTSAGDAGITLDGSPSGNSVPSMELVRDFSGTATMVRFTNISGSPYVGSITSTTSATAYNTSSDERLKENIKDSDDSGSKVDAIQVRQFDWKADGEHQDYGMVAQELLEVAPDAVTQGDTPDDMMGVDYSKLVPMLIKEIQSLRQRVAQLEE
jgi:hypothetical protein